MSRIQLRRRASVASRSLFVPTLALAACALGSAVSGGCASVAVVGAAIVVNDEFVNNAQVAVVPYDSEFVWASVKSTMSHMTSDLLEVDADLKAVRTYVDSALTTVQVETYDIGQTRIRVASKKYMVYNDQIARMVQERIVLDLD